MNGEVTRSAMTPERMTIPINVLGDSPPYILLCTSQESIKAVIDTGASDNFVSLKTKARIPKTNIRSSESMEESVSLADGSKTSIIGRFILMFTIKGTQHASYFYVLEELSYEALLGRQFLWDLNVAIDFRKREISLTAEPVWGTTVDKVTIPPQSQLCLPLRLSKAIPDRSVVAVWPKHSNKGAVVWTAHTLTVVDNDHVYVPVLNPSSEKCTIKKGWCLAVIDNDVEVAGDKDINLQSAKQTPVKHHAADNSDCFDLVNSSLTDEDRLSFQNMLKSIRWAFATDASQLGHFKDIPLRIEVDTSAPPPATRPYRASPKIQEAIDSQIQEMVRVGVIEESDSPYRAPIVMVKKKCGKLRMCIDYRKINDLILKRPFPLRTREQIFNLVAAKRPIIYTSLDMISGYWQVEVEKESRPFTAFSTQHNTYQFTRVPFGICSAPWHFSRCINYVTKGLDPHICASYLDDIVIFSPSHLEHLQHVKKVITQVASFGLRFNPSKCIFAVSECSFLGHILTPHGVKPQPCLISKIQDFERPHSIKGVKRFLGLIQYYGAFIPHLSSLTKHLHKFTKKGAKLIWDRDAERSFHLLRNALLNDPLLIHPDYSKTFYLLCDASDDTIGSALCHKVDGIFRPIAYYSAKMNGAQTRYPVTEKEGLAIVLSLKHFQPTIEGEKIHILTDHLPVKSLLESPSKASSNRLTRWALFLQDKIFTIEYIKGTDNILADFLSRIKTKNFLQPAVDVPLKEEALESDRGMTAAVLTRARAHAASSVPTPFEAKKPQKSLPRGVHDEAQYNHDNTMPVPEQGDLLSMHTDDSRQTPTSYYTSTTPVPFPAQESLSELSTKSIIEHQKRDPFCQRLRTYLSSGKCPEGDKELKETLIYSASSHLQDDLLVYYPRIKKSRNTIIKLKGRIILPELLRDKALSVLHGHILLGSHCGREALYDKVIEHFWWPAMTKDIALYVRQCHSCARKKRVAHARPQLTIPEDPPYPFCHIAIDFIGKLPVSARGHLYILTIVDLLTGYVEAVPLSDQTSSDVLYALVEKVYTRYGFPQRILTDNAANFRSQLLSAIHKTLGIHQVFITPYHSQGNGRCERMNKEIQSIIASYLDTECDNWDRILPYAIWGINSKPNSRHGMAPYTLLFGRDPPLLDSQLATSDKIPTSAQDMLSEIQSRLDIVHKIAEENREFYNQNMRERFDKGAKPHQFRVGDLVLVFDPMYKHKSMKKFSTKYSRPHRIVEIRSNSLARLQELDSGKIMERLTNVNRLKRYYIPKEGVPQEPTPSVIDPDIQFIDDQNETYFPIQKILATKKINKIKHHHVKWADGTKSWVQDNMLKPTTELSQK